MHIMDLAQAQANEGPTGTEIFLGAIKTVACVIAGGCFAAAVALIGCIYL